MLSKKNMPIEMIVQPKLSKEDLEKRKKAMQMIDKIREKTRMTKAELDELIETCKKERDNRGIHLLDQKVF